MAYSISSFINSQARNKSNFNNFIWRQFVIFVTFNDIFFTILNLFIINNCLFVFVKLVSQ